MANNQGNGRNVAMPDENRPSWRPQDESGQRNRRSMSEDDDRERMMRDRDRDDERFMQRDRDRYGHWEDRSTRWDRDEGYRATERYGQGQSGYGAGRYEGDRSYESRNQGYPSSYDERMRDRGPDERYAVGRGGSNWREERREERGDERGGQDRSSYGREYRGGEYRGGGGYLGQGGQQMGGDWGNEGYSGGYGQGGWGQGTNERYSQQGILGGGYSQTDQRIGAARGGWNQQSSQYGGRGVQGQGGLYGQGGYNEGMYGQGGMQHRFGSQGYQGYGQHRGKGPSGFTRSDERIKEMVCEALTDNDQVDATHIDITVKNGEVVLSGTVEDRHQKRIAEDVVEQCSGVKDVQNQIRVGADKKVSGKETESTPSQDKRNRA